MRKIGRVGRTVACLLVLLAVTGCAKNEDAAGSPQTGGRDYTQQTGVAEVLAAGIAEADAFKSGIPNSDNSGTDRENTDAVNSDISGADEAADDGVLSGAAGSDARPTGLNDNAPVPTLAYEDAVLSSTEGIDIDLTQLSGSMVYAEVYDMLYQPESYLGKIIRMNGLYSEYHDEDTGNSYYACIIQDATACCAQGIEFVLTERYSYPEDYPQEGDTVTVTGAFDIYEEDGFEFYTLRNAELEM